MFRLIGFIPVIPPERNSLCNVSIMHELEVQITDELALAESSRPEDPVVESDAGRRPNPTDVKAYETRLLTVRGYSRSCGGGGTARAEVMAESVTVVNLESHKARESSSA